MTGTRVGALVGCGGLTGGNIIIVTDIVGWPGCLSWLLCRFHWRLCWWLDRGRGRGRDAVQVPIVNHKFALLRREMVQARVHGIVHEIAYRIDAVFKTCISAYGTADGGRRFWRRVRNAISRIASTFKCMRKSQPMPNLMRRSL
jgi:hypothetical protein